MQSLSGRHAQEEGRAHGQGYRNVKLSPYIKRRVSYESSLDMALSFDTDVFPPVIGKQEIDSPALWANPMRFMRKMVLLYLHVGWPALSQGIRWTAS